MLNTHYLLPTLLLKGSDSLQTNNIPEKQMNEGPKSFPNTRMESQSLNSEYKKRLSEITLYFRITIIITK